VNLLMSDLFVLKGIGAKTEIACLLAVLQLLNCMAFPFRSVCHAKPIYLSVYSAPFCSIFRRSF
jgi:hypothetical protein